MSHVQRRIESKIGPLFLVASETGLVGVFWKEQASPYMQNNSTKQMALLDKAETQIHQYLDAKRTTFDLPLDIQGTPFQKQVWNQLTQIPFGKTISYKELAIRVKNEKASRAVGTANGRNPLSLIIPCHRVIAANGTLGGYAGGLSIKKHLLHLENSHVANSR